MDQRLRAEALQLDRQLGNRLKRAREAANVTQSALASAIGLTFQQIQKYERATNRVSCSTLILIARALGCRASVLLGEKD